MSGRRQPELDGPDLPHEASHVWGWFMRLNATRPAGMGASGIPETEIAAFFRTRKLSPAQWEIEAIAALDDVAMRAANDDAKPDGATLSER